MKQILALGLSAIALFTASTALADANIESTVIGWRLQNYVPNNLVVYYTGSPCTSGSLTFGPAATADDRNRFYSLILTARSTGKKIGVFYETVSGGCQIQSFYTLD
ncbi:MAG: hypothetical protein JF570_05825 [Caulobacter sp.]|nr:hypothetical protein [Caulobacter sp.]